jgi:hypothetical protein
MQNLSLLLPGVWALTPMDLEFLLFGRTLLLRHELWLLGIISGVLWLVPCSSHLQLVTSFDVSSNVIVTLKGWKMCHNT